MASPHLVNPIKTIDPVAAMRLLVGDLEALADRLGLKQKSRALQQRLKSTHERVFGPRTALLLLSESAAVKRRFLERLLGPLPAGVPEPTVGCLRLEHGAEAEYSATMPQGMTASMPLDQLPQFLSRRGDEMTRHWRQTVRLPSPALAKELAVIDTPSLETGSNAGSWPEAGSLLDTAAWLREAAEQADCWIFVMQAGALLSERSIAALRLLSHAAVHLDVVAEGAERLGGDARQAAREQLIQTLEARCGLKDPRLTLLASSGAEGEVGSFWHGRFASFQSVTLMRGRECWLERTREVIAEALDEVGEEIRFELEGTNLGLRPARLRLGAKDLDGLRTRLGELALLIKPQTRPAPSLALAILWPESSAPAETAPGTPPALRATAPETVAPLAVAKVSESAAGPGNSIAASDASGAKAEAARHQTQSSPKENGPGKQREDDERLIASLWSAVASGAPALAMAAHPELLGREFSPESFESSQEPNSVATTPGIAREATTLDRPASATQVQLSPEALASRAVASLTPWQRFSSRLTAAGVRTWLPNKGRLAALALLAAALWLIVWASWPRNSGYSREPAAQWSPSDLQQLSQPTEPPAALTAGTTSTSNRILRTHRRGGDGLVAEPSFTDLGLAQKPRVRPAAPQSDPSKATASSAANPQSTVRAAVPQLGSQASGTEDGADANSSSKSQHHRRLLGLGKVWHWVHRDDPDARYADAHSSRIK